MNQKLMRATSFAVMLVFALTLLPLELFPTSAASAPQFNGFIEPASMVSAQSNDFIAPIEPIDNLTGWTAISDREGLEAIKNNLSGNYYLTADIDLSGSEWIPIGSIGTPFTGIFDGQGHIISNLTITGYYDYSGLFGYVEYTGDVGIKNVGLKDTNINITSNSFSDIFVGGICGSYDYYDYNSSGDYFLINNCFNMGDVFVVSYNGRAYTGGICGYNQTSHFSIDNCYNTGSVSVSSDYSLAGGICGQSFSSINNCYNTGDVFGSSISSRAVCGGICGSSSSSSFINNCYNTGNVTASSNNNIACAGGICGSNSNSSGSSKNNCYNAGDVTVSSNNNVAWAGGICGLSIGYSESTINNCYWNSDSSQTINGNLVAWVDKKGIGQINSGGVDTTIPLTTAQMKQQSSFTGFDFDDVWEINSSKNNGYPVFITRVCCVSLDKKILTKHVGETDQLTAIVAPSNARNQNITWSSSDSSVVAVNSSGQIEAKSLGTATITVTTVDGSYTADCVVNVVPIDVTGISLNKTATSMEVGGTETLTTVIAPSNATNQNVIWSSNNPSVATVDNNGEIIALSAGWAVITATTEDGNFTAHCEVSVNNRKVTDPIAIARTYSGDLQFGNTVMYDSKITLNCSTFTDEIRYTTDGTEPTETSTLYTIPVTITEATTLKIKAYKANWEPSDTAVFTYSVKIATPTGSPVPGAVTSGTSISLLCTTPDTTIRYTTNGTEPTENSSAYSTPIPITTTTTIKAKAFRTGFIASDTATLTYSTKVFAPTSNYVSGTILASGDSVTLSCATPNATIRYTTDKSEPNANSTVYSSPITITSVKAKAFADGLIDSNTVTFVYSFGERVAEPTASHANGSTIPCGEKVTLYCEQGAIIKYTTTGFEPTENSLIYSSPIMITAENKEIIIKAKAFKNSKASSNTVTFTYKVGEPQYLNASLGKINVKIPSGVPFIEGQSFNLDLSSLPVCVIYGDGKIIVAGGYKFKPNANEEQKAYEKIKEANILKDYLFNRNEFAPYDGELKGILNSQVPMDAFMMNIKPDISFAVYLEGVLSKDGVPGTLSGRLMLKIGAKSQTQYQVFAGPIPIAITLDIGASVTFSGGATWVNMKELVPTAAIDIVLPHIKVMGGVGTAYVASIGAYGSADLMLHWNIINRYSNLKLKGELGGYAKLFIFQYNLKVWSGTWNIGEWYDNSISTAKRSTYSGFSSNNLYEQDNYTPAPRDYLLTQSPWLDMPVSAKSHASTSAGSYKIIQHSVYDQTAPLIAEANGQRVMVFLADDGSRDDMNRTKLMYSIYNDISGSWSVPKAINDDGTANFYPSIVSDGKDIWVTWHKSKTTFNNNSTLNDVLAASEIAVAKFNGTGFADYAVLTSNDVLDTQPKIAVNGSDAVAVWVENADNDIFGTSGYKNKIMISQLTGNAWNSPVELKDELGAVVDMDVGYFGNDARIAYITDGDNSFETLDDRSLIVINSSGTVVNNPAIGSLISNLRFTKINGVQALSWYEDRNIRYMTADGMVTTMFEEPNMPTDNYKIINNAVIYPTYENEIGYLTARLFQNGKWGNPFKLAKTDNYASYFDGVYNNGEFEIVFNNSKLEIVGDELVETNDLCSLKATVPTNIAVTSVYYSNEEVELGKTLSVSIDVENIGGTAVNNVAVMVNGTQIETFSISELQTGETTTIDFNLNVPNITAPTDFKITVEPAANSDIDMSDNSVIITFGYSDLSLMLSKNYNEDETVTISADVTNNSDISANAKLLVHRGTSDGDVIDIVDLGTVSGRDNENTEFNFDPDIIVPDGEEYEVLYFELISDGEELYSASKSNFAVLFAKNQSAISSGISPTITTTNLPSGTIGTAYNSTLIATGDEPITWSIGSGSLPNGLDLLADGKISGTPTTSGTFNFTVEAANGVGIDTKSFTITITGGNNTPTLIAPMITATSLPNGTINTVYNQTLTATGTVTTWSIDSGSLPAGLSLDSASGVMSGTPTATGTFNFTVKATNGVGSDTKALSITITGGDDTPNPTPTPNPSPNPVPTPTTTTESGKGTIDPKTVIIRILKESEFAGVKGLSKVKLPKNKLVIAANVQGEQNGYKAFKITAEQLKAANLSANKVRLWFISDSGKVTEEPKRIVINADGSITINLTHFSAYVLAETAPLECTTALALEAVKLSLKNTVTVDEIEKFDCNYDDKVSVKDALFILKASIAD